MAVSLNVNKGVVDKRPVFSGTFGNNSVGIFTYTTAGEDAGSEYILGKIPRYATVHTIKLVNAALGASSTIDLGYKTAEVGGTLTADPDYWLDGQATANAASTVSAAVPKQFTEEVYITATSAVAATTGVINVVVEYLYQSK